MIHDICIKNMEIIPIGFVYVCVCFKNLIVKFNDDWEL